MLSEFNRAIKHLSDKVEEGNDTTKEVLVEAKKTNGRVYALERGHDVLSMKLSLLQERFDDSDPLTKRDLYVGLGVLAAAGGLVTWLPKLLAAAVAP